MILWSLCCKPTALVREGFGHVVDFREVLASTPPPPPPQKKKKRFREKFLASLLGEIKEDSVLGKQAKDFDDLF